MTASWRSMRDRPFWPSGTPRGPCVTVGASSLSLPSTRSGPHRASRAKARWDSSPWLPQQSWDHGEHCVPGSTYTDLLHSANIGKALSVVVGVTPLGRLGQPTDVADVVTLLVGSMAAGSPARISAPRAASWRTRLGSSAARYPRPSGLDFERTGGCMLFRSWSDRSSSSDRSAGRGSNDLTRDERQ
jgi:hypothetical protein